MAQINGLLDLNINGKRSSQKALFCDTIFSFPVKDTWPTGIAYDGSFLWSCGSDFQYIYKYSMTGILIDSIPNPSNSYGTQGIVFDGNFLWALAEQEDKIYKLDTSNGFIIGQINIPLSTNGFGLTFDGNYLWTSDYISGILSKIDTSSGQIISNISLAKPVLDIVIINNNLFGLAQDYSNLYKIDTANGAFVDSVSWCIPYPLGITWDGTYLWNISSKLIYGGNQKAYKIDLSTFITAINSTHTSNNFNLKIFPNPFSSSTTLKTDIILKNATLTVYNFYGQIVKQIDNFSGQTIIFQRDNLPSGLYFIRLTQDNKTFSTDKLTITE